jgi:hypothetical protein
MSATAGFFQAQVDPNWNYWISPENVRYVQTEVARRLRQKYREYIEVEYDRAKSMIIHTKETWRGPLNLNELLEMVICDFVKDIDTDIEWRNRFNHYEPRTLYFPGTDLTREEKVKVNPGYKFEFQMRY